MAKELLAYDDDTLLREMKMAELEWEQQKADDPELEKQAEKDAEAGFEALLKQIREKNLTPVSEKAYSEKKAEEDRKIVRVKLMKRVLLVAALVGVMVVGTGFTVSAMKEFQYRHASVGKTKNQAMWYNDVYKEKVNGLEDAYREISDELGNATLILGYKPVDVVLEQLTVRDGRAQMEFSYKNEKLYFKQIKNPKEKVMDTVTSDRMGEHRVFNSKIKKYISIEENEPESGKTEYSAEFELGDTFYYLSGFIEKKEFIKIIENLAPYQK